MTQSNTTTTTEPHCADAGDGSGLGCPDCKRFEVRPHSVEHEDECDEECADHMALACCWCGTHFFTFTGIEPAPELKSKAH